MKFLRIVAVILTGSTLLAGCSKDKFETVPHIRFNSFSSNVAFFGVGQTGPELNIQLNDAEGDLGYAGQNTYVYVKNISTPPFKLDSFRIPDLSRLTRKNMDVEVGVNIKNVLSNSGQTNTPYTDTLFFDVYVKDLAGNQSNTITTPEPFFFITP